MENGEVKKSGSVELPPSPIRHGPDPWPECLYTGAYTFHTVPLPLLTHYKVVIEDLLQQGAITGRKELVILAQHLMGVIGLPMESSNGNGNK